MNHIRFLHYFDEVARVGSIRQAAERLHVAPSAVNRRIQDLEEELDLQLFERLPRGMRLTSAGELFVRYVRNQKSELAKVRSDIEELQSLRRGSISISASQALAPTVLPQVMAQFRQRHPLVVFQVRIGDHQQALAALRNFESDLALVVNLEREPDIDFALEHPQRLMAIMHRGHPLAKKEPGVRLRDCIDFPLVLPNRDVAGRQMIEKFLARSSIKLNAAVESNSFEFMRGCLHHDQAISFQIEAGVVSDGGVLVARDIVDRGFPQGQLVLAQLRGRQLPVVSHAFTEHLKQSLGAKIKEVLT